MGWVLTRDVFRTCKHCAKAKAKQQNVRKESVSKKTTIPGNGLYLNLSKVTAKLGTSKNRTMNCYKWKVLVCEATGKKWSDFTVTKSDMVERTCVHLHKLKSHNILVCYITWTQQAKIRN